MAKKISTFKGNMQYLFANNIKAKRASTTLDIRRNKNENIRNIEWSYKLDAQQDGISLQQEYTSIRCIEAKKIKMWNIYVQK